MGPIAVEVSVAILHEQRAHIAHSEVAGARFGGDVEIEHHLPFGLLLHTVEHGAEVSLAGLGDGLYAVDLEIIDAVLAMEFEEPVGITLPICEILAGVGSEPQAELDSF